jgi:DNA end-binding protein Ku
MVSPDGTPLARRYFCPKEERELDWDEIVRGYEIEKDTYVVVTDDELERLAPERTRDIDLRRSSMPRHRPDLLRAGVLSDARRQLDEGVPPARRDHGETGRAGIATFVMRGKEYLVAILAENGILRAETLRFADEVRTAADVGLPEPVKPKAARSKSTAKKSRTKQSLAKKSGSKSSSTKKSGAALEGRSKEDLYEQAKQRGIPGRSGMSKDELIAALERSA